MAIPERNMMINRWILVLWLMAELPLKKWMR
jgi:hypothetical protein